MQFLEAELLFLTTQRKELERKKKATEERILEVSELLMEVKTRAYPPAGPSTRTAPSSVSTRTEVLPPDLW